MVGSRPYPFHVVRRSAGVAWLCFLVGVVSGAKEARSAEVISFDRSRINFFETNIRPVLVSKCYTCHSLTALKARKLKANLLLDSRGGMLSGGESGPAIVPGKPDESLLIEAIRYESLEMPPEGKLTDEVIAQFEEWIEMGAPDPRDDETINRPDLKLNAGREHWAFQPLQDSTIPTIDDSWVRTPIDQFVLAKLDQHRLTPTANADRRTLIRRAYFDLTGLPPTPQQVREFVNDASETAYEDLVDRLLENLHYGERWGRHWLDVARFGESEGSNPEEDKLRPDAYKYRDAVIKAFNEDMPYDEFVSAQVAGVGMRQRWPLSRDLAQFVKLGTRLQRNTHPNDKKFHVLDDMVSATGSAFLGITIGCARCHDHKLDPITAEEYYRLTAVFFDLVEVKKKVGVNTLSVIREPHLLAGGSWQRPVKRVEPGFLRVLMTSGNRSDTWIAADVAAHHPRQALARWMTDVERGAGGLLARVLVNRVWHYHFGRGIVSTPNDFGHLGAPPTHPQLLDWLAGELIRNQWQLKPLHRLIMTSAVYRQAASDRWSTVDRDNQWLWHYRTRRLEAEAIRDNMLCVSGGLKTEMYGPSIEIKPDDHGREAHEWRRSIYLMSPRFETHSVLRAFDPPNTFHSHGGRAVSTTASSALFMFNSTFVWEQAELFAERVTRDAGREVAAQVSQVYEIAFSRPPTTEERLLGIAFLEHDDGKTRDESALTRYCHTIMGLNEFIYVR